MNVFNLKLGHVYKKKQEKEKKRTNLLTTHPTPLFWACLVPGPALIMLTFAKMGSLRHEYTKYLAVALFCDKSINDISIKANYNSCVARNRQPLTKEKE